MVLNIAEIKDQLINESVSIVYTGSFNEDMDAVRQFNDDSDTSLIDTGKNYFSELLGSEVEIEQDETYTTIRKI